MMVRRHSPYVALVVLSIAVPISLRAGADVTVLRSDARSIVIEYRPRFVEAQKIEADGRQFVLQNVRGTVRPGEGPGPGSPDLRTRSLPIAFPGRESNSATVIAADYEDVPSVMLAPVPQVRVVAKQFSSTYVTDPTRYGSNAFFPAALATISHIGRVRDMLIGSLHIAPFQYNPVLRLLRKYKRIVVEVSYGPANANLRQRGTDKLLKSVPLNYTAAAAWGRRSLAATAAPTPSVLASGDWIRLTVAAEGMYRLDAPFLSALGIDLTSIDPRTIKIFGNGGRELPEDVTVPRTADLVEDAIYVAGESDGKFDPTDYVVFFGRGARGWSYDPSAKTLNHYLNHYSEVNYYWLTYGGAQGKRMVQQASLPASSSVLGEDTFTDGVAVEDEKVNLLHSGKDWYGQEVDPGGSFTYVNILPGLVPNGRILYRYALVAGVSSTPVFTVDEGAAQIGLHFIPTIYPGSNAIASRAVYQVTGTSTLVNSTSQLSFAFSAQGATAKGWVDWLEILYPRTLSAVNDSLHFRGPDTSAVVEYHLQQFSTTPMVFDVRAHENVRMITGLTGSFLFRAGDTSGAPGEYWAVAGSAFRTPAAGARIANEDLRGYSGGADFIIVTSPEFRSGADMLKARRESQTNGPLKTLVADVNQIYDEFAGGMPDVTAIRDFLNYAYSSWTPQPQFVLFLGQGSYDYKGIQGSRSSYVPTWESAESEDLVASYSSDDYFLMFSYPSSFVPSLVFGRVNARSEAEADGYVQKLARYEDASGADAWKMRALYIADDAWNPDMNPPEIGDGTIHGDAMEALASETPDEIEKRKIYEAEYPTVWTASGRTKPGAYQDIIDQVNQGVLVVNFAGHGNQMQFTHENIFNVATSIPQLTNSDRLPFWFLATCNFSDFDDPEIVTGSEVLINKPDGGGISVIAATREVYAGDNLALSLGTYDYLFTTDAYGRLSMERPATALFRYKVYGGNDGQDDNDQKYFYMGDPTMYLQFPKGFATFESANGIALDSAGIPNMTVAQFRSLGRVTLSGTIRGMGNGIDTTYQGIVQVSLNDATRRDSIIDYYPGVNWGYAATGGLVFRGDNTVKNGRFSATFIVPKDIEFSDSLSRGRLLAYVTPSVKTSSDAAAYTGNVHIGGVDTTAVHTSTGPKISVYIGSRSFRSGDLISQNAALLVDLADSVGINTSTSGIGHGIEMWLNDATQGKDLTNFYASNLDSYRSGTVQYPMTNLPQGKNTLRIRAWNSYDYSSTADTYFQVASSDQLTITNVFNYPNPFGGEGTEFTFQQNQTVPLNVTVKIFTIAGRLIQTLESFASGDSFVRLPWDGRDRDGDRIANGVYLYKLVVRTADGRFSSEVLGKMSKIQ